MGNMSEKKLPYPKSAIFVLVHQVFERFSYWGIVVILPLFLRNILDFTDDSATAIYHGFTIFGYLSSFVGAIIADSYLGKFRTVIWFSFVYFAGTAFLTISATPLFNSGLTLTTAMVGLVLTALASGSIKPCIIAFGGDQFQLPEQQQQLDSYFPFMYLVINFSLFLTAIIMPMLRKDVSCFELETCYPLAFVVPFAFIILSFVLIIVGKSTYHHVPVSKNVVLKSAQCIKTAIIEKFKSKKKKDHWLDHAETKYDKTFIEENKTVLNLFVLFLPVTMFWALIDQQYSRWTFQATRMNGKTFGYSIKPDQFATLNFVLTFLTIPLFENVVYPLLSKFNILKKPLQRVVIGSMFASLGFAICACVELKIESAVKPIPIQMETQLNIINAAHCEVKITLSSDDNSYFIEVDTIKPYENQIFIEVPSGQIKINLQPGQNTYVGCENMKSDSYVVMADSAEAYSLLIYTTDAYEFKIVIPNIYDDLIKSHEGNSKLSMIYAGLTHENSDAFISLESSNENVYEYKLEGENGILGTDELVPNEYDVKFQNGDNSIPLGNIDVLVGGNYILAISIVHNSSEIFNDPTKPLYVMKIYTMTEPNSVHMILLLPQYIVMSWAEVMLEVSLTAYAYTQAPQNMKSLLQIVNLIPPALGGVFVVVIAQSKFFSKQSIEFFFFAGINFLAAIVLMFLAKNYIPVNNEDEEDEDNISNFNSRGEKNPGFEDDTSVNDFNNS